MVVDTWNPWQIRLRITGVVTNDSGHVNGVAGSGISTSDTVIPELDISYYFTKNWAAELILGTTYSYIDGTGSLNGTAVGKTWLLLPPPCCCSITSPTSAPSSPTSAPA